LKGINSPWIIGITGEQLNTFVEENIQLEKSILGVPSIKGTKAVVGLKTPLRNK
jgi:hypothetical protein